MTKDRTCLDSYAAGDTIQTRHHAFPRCLKPLQTYSSTLISIARKCEPQHPFQSMPARSMYAGSSHFSQHKHIREKLSCGGARSLVFRSMLAFAARQDFGRFWFKLGEAYCRTLVDFMAALDALLQFLYTFRTCRVIQGPLRQGHLEGIHGHQLFSQPSPIQVTSKGCPQLLCDHPAKLTHISPTHAEQRHACASSLSLM